MAQYRLVWDENVGYSGPLRPESPSVWDYILPAPPWPHSILIADDGTVVEKETPTVPETKAARTYIGGGRVFVVDDADPDYAALVAAGYTLEAL